MLILTSNGLSTNQIINNMRPFVHGLSKAVIVTTASVGYKEKDWNIPRLKSELNELGLSIDFFDFDTQDAELLLNYDLIEINGGNPFYLLRAINKPYIKEVLRKIASNRILIGISAGSLVLQENIDLIAQYSPKMNETVGLTDFSGLGITKLKVLPHYSRFLHQFDCFEERAREYEILNDCNVIRMDDGQGIIVSEDDFFFI